MRDFGQSEHSFAQEDVHWSPGNCASAKKKEGEEERRFMHCLDIHTVWTYRHTECLAVNGVSGLERVSRLEQRLTAVGRVKQWSGVLFEQWGWWLRRRFIRKW
jgi:hypothetical protein